MRTLLTSLAIAVAAAILYPAFLVALMMILPIGGGIGTVELAVVGLGYLAAIVVPAAVYYRRSSTGQLTGA